MAVSRLARHSTIGLLLLSVGFGVLACGLLGALAASAAPGDDLLAARARWAAHPLPRYRLVVDEETNAGSCRQDLRISGERIAEVLQNRCVRVPSWTVANLFGWAAGLEDHAARCYPSAVACVCHIVYTTRASFDPQLGYPQRIAYQWKLTTNWAYPGHWERLLRQHELPSCDQVTRRASGHITVTVVSLTPLP